MKKILLLAVAVSFLFGVEIGQKPKEVVLSGENGGYVKDNSPWSSSSIKGKVYVLLYVDPDEKDLNEHFIQALKKRHFDRKNYGSIAVINMKATWKPDFIIEKILSKKQEEFKDTIYVKDKASILVNEWSVANDNSDVLVFDKEGRLLFYKAGKMEQDDMQKVFELIETHM